MGIIVYIYRPRNSKVNPENKGTESALVLHIGQEIICDSKVNPENKGTERRRRPTS